ncbi:MAG: hypothetical protein JJU29_05935 [Verrucomicrobia bacterium]|nr:hypothetical protein [Verrucomicrobiota bacterium]MCH8510707.1 hypothetical protein [Kiritimatiellia bacterium]
MNIFNQIFGGSKDWPDPIKKADPLNGISNCKTTLVKTLGMASVVTSMTLMEQFPEFVEVLKRSQSADTDWDFFFIAGGAGMVTLSSGTSEALRKDIFDDLTLLNERLTHAISDLNQFLEGKDGRTKNPINAVGLWILWNVGGQQPTYEESKRLVPAIGGMLAGIARESVNDA